MAEKTIDGTPIDDIIMIGDMGCYRRIEVSNPDKLERYTVYVKYAYGRDDYEIEEIDVDAHDMTDARIVAELALLRDYEPGGKIHRVIHRPRGLMYM